MRKDTVAIIGAGLGGISAAIYLRKFGFNVDVYEQSNFAGGKASRVEFDGFSFDSGPTLFTMPFVLKDLFDISNEDFLEFIELIKPDIICKYFFPDGTIINAYSQQKKFAEEIQNKTCDKACSVMKYFDYCKTIYDKTADLFLQKSFTEISTFLNIKALKTLFSINKIDTGRTMHNANQSFFKDEKTVQLFDRYATYNGSNPFLAPATLNIIQHVEYGIGGFIPRGGIRKISSELVKLAEKKGVNFFFNSSVQKILIEKNNVNGIQIEYNQNLHEKKYNVVISNADVNFTYQRLLAGIKLKQAERYIKHEPSTSALVFYWGIEGNYKNLETHNILFSDDYKSEFDDLFKKKICPIDPTIYIYISSKFNNDDAPSGYENWYVMINAPYIIGQNWESEIQKSRERIIKKINRIFGIEIEKKIVGERILSPEMIEKNTSSYKGSLYGISSNSKFSAFLRQQNRSKEVKGLYFCGGSAHPGGGIPLVLLSGKITAELINKYEKR